MYRGGMPELQIPAGYAHVRFVHTLEGAQGNVEVTLGTAVGSADQGEANAISAAYVGNLLEDASTSLVLTNVIVLFGNGTATPNRFEVPQSSAGGRNVDPMSPNTAILVQKRTTLSGRKNRGRWYLPARPRSFLGTTGDTISGAALTDIQDSVDAWLLAHVATVGNPVILHTDATPPTTISAFSVQPRVATQRRRLRD
jgi:hypothetical protein